MKLYYRSIEAHKAYIPIQVSPQQLLNDEKGQTYYTMIPRAYRDPPPSYAEATGVVDLDNQANIRRHSTTNTSPTPVYGSSSSVAPHIFPPAFCLYCLSTRHYVIGQSQYLPLYAVSTHATLSSKPDLVIYNGASEDTPPLAFVDHEAFSRSAGITLPARQDSRFPASHELLESGGPFTRIMSFNIETAVSDGRREHFEWRHSSGVEVEALGGRHSVPWLWRGWKPGRTMGDNGCCFSVGDLESGATGKESWAGYR
ncbi:hypothetical protein CHU98_g1738 [Xylaria longipes]|nr:hypothetical protein CHU98_g1738 [Xylaria longipes]